MTKPHITNLSYTYKKPDTDVSVLNSDDIPLDKSLIKDHQIIYFGPKSIAGNHKHPRREWFIALGELVLVWLDDKGNAHEELMNPAGKLLLFELPPYLPHSVYNRSTSEMAVLLEYSDSKIAKVERIIVKSL